MNVSDSSPANGPSSPWKVELGKVFDEEQVKELVAIQEYAYKKATKLVQDYQRIFSSDNGDFIRDEGLLPAPKDKIKRAYALHFSRLPESKRFQITKEILHLAFFGEKREECTTDLNYLRYERESWSGNSEAAFTVGRRHDENEDVRTHWDKFAKDLNFEEKANNWRNPLVNEFTQLSSSPDKAVDRLEEFSDGKFSSQLFADYRSFMKNFSKNSSQSSGCLSLLMIAALPVAIYAMTKIIT